MPSPPDLLSVEPVPGGTLVRVAGPDVTDSTAAALADQLLALARSGGEVALHLGAVEFLTSGLLGRLIVLDRALRDVGGRLSLFNLRPQVYQVFAAARMTDLLDIRAIPLPSAA